MKHLLKWLAVFFCLPALAINITFTAADVQQQAQGVRRLVLVPLEVSSVNPLGFTAGDSKMFVTDTNSSVTASNLIGGTFMALYRGPYQTTTNYYTFPSSNISDYATNPAYIADAVYSAVPSYSKAVSDRIYIRHITSNDGSASISYSNAIDGLRADISVIGVGAGATNAAITIAANSNAVYQAEFANSNALYQAEFANSNAVYQAQLANSNTVYQSKFVNKSGDTMTGGLTNNSGYYGETMVLTGATIQVTLQGKADDSAAAIQLFRTTASGNGWELQKDQDSAGGFFRLNSSTNSFVNLNQWFSWNPVTGATINSGAGFFGIGSGLTALNGSQVTSGTIADARLSANVPLLNADNHWTGHSNVFDNPIYVGSNSQTTIIYGSATVDGTFTNGGPAYFSNSVVALPGGSFYGLVPSGAETNAAGSRVAYLSDVGGSGGGYNIDTSGIASNATAEIAVWTNSHLMTTTNSLLLESWVDLDGPTNYLAKHWDAYFRDQTFIGSNTITSFSSATNLTARWALLNSTGLVLYVKGYTNESLNYTARAIERTWQTNGVVTSAGGGSYSPATASQDGTGQYDWTGFAAANSQLSVISLWVKMGAGTDGTQYDIVRQGATSHFTLRRTTSNTLIVYFADGTGTAVAQGTTTSTLTVASGWVNILVSVDLTQATAAAGFHCYFNNADTTLTGITWVSGGTIGWSSGGTVSWPYGAGWSGCVSEWYINTAQTLDVSVSGNRAKFNDGATPPNPISLGATGSLPTGTTPYGYFKGSATGFVVNSGTGPNWVKNVGNDLTTCASTP